MAITIDGNAGAVWPHRIRGMIRETVSLTRANPRKRWMLPVGTDTSRLAVELRQIQGVVKVRVGLYSHTTEQFAEGQYSGGDPYSLALNPSYRLGPRGLAYMRATEPELSIGPSGNVYRFWRDVPTEWATSYDLAVGAFVELELLDGVCETEIVFTSERAEAPRIFAKNSVAFDAANSAEEVSGDGILSLSHTAGGTESRAVYAGVTWQATGGTGGTVTFGGSGMTSINNVQAFAGLDSTARVAHYRLAIGGTLTGAQTVTSTRDSAGTVHSLGVISMTGVDQTTPVGTAPTPTTGSASPATITVASIGADDMVVDTMLALTISVTGAGADQTSRCAQDHGGYFLRMSTQPGTAGGVMSWTLSGSDGWGSVAVAFKPAAAGSLGWLSRRRTRFLR